MPNYGKYNVAVRLLLLKQYLEANAGRNRFVSRKELEDLLRDNEMPIKNPKTLYADFAALGVFVVYNSTTTNTKRAIGS